MIDITELRRAAAELEDLTARVTPPRRTTALHKVLHQIAANPGSTTESLMAATSLSYPGVAKALAKGVEFRWFERRALSNPSSHGPRFSFHLTPAGEKAYKDSHA